MASTRNCIIQWSRGSVSSSFRPPSQCLRASPITQQTRNAAVLTGSNSANAAKYKRKELSTAQKKKKQRSTFVNHDLKDMEQFALCDAMRYIRAFEVGSQRNPKYELHVKLRTLKNGPVVRNRLRLPHPVKTDIRICVICPPDSKAATQAKQAGAVLIGEDVIFDAVKEGRIEFDRCICHVDSLPKLAKSGVARILGPRGLMPSAKMGSVVKDVTSAVKDLTGGSEYRERMGVVRLAIGQLGFTPDMLQKNIKAFVDMLKKDMAAMSDRMNKELHEVVLSSTNAPGFSLNGEFKSNGGVQPKELTAA
ncbi:ribosomal protein L1 [Tothia fuscella]|uniref:Ribosomal protein L1 n=1 Tax=Tothia fuscella TaxID=1048955 RepID=A0A9P4NHM5_9PEZI|nr:ribosomal protein L1 [Tothia fuscella]